MNEEKRPTGIIRTLPSLYSDGSAAARKFWKAVERVEKGKSPAVNIALQQKPIHEFLHVYLLVDGEINIRFNIAGYDAGYKAKCFDDTYREPKFWAICSGPVSRPEAPIKRRGFQGFRYVYDPLW